MKHIKKKLLSSLICIMFSLIMFTNVLAAVEYDFTLQNGDVGITYTTSKSRDTVTKVTETSMTIVSQSKTWSGGNVSVTIYNATSSTATLSFDYTLAGNYDSCSLDTSVTKFSQLIEPGAYITITLKGKSSLGSYDDVTLSVSNISLIAAKASSKVTIQYESSLGAVSIDGTPIDTGAFEQVALDEGVLLEATSNEGTTFHGWVNEADNSVLSTAASYTLTPAADMTVKAVFTGSGSNPYFGVGAATQQSASIGLLGLEKLYYYTVGTSYIFDDLNDATTYAENSTNKYITLLNSATLSAGDYTIPAGVTLLIPFDDSNTLYTTKAEYSTSNPEPTADAYRTLTMADGAKLIINGAVSVSGKHRYVQGSSIKNIYGGAPTGSVGFVDMESGSSIEVKSGGALYVYGFITGDGSVSAKSGATVYEIFQITDYRGGEQSTDMKNGVFPISQYYVQNIEVPLTLYSGATEYGYTTVNANGSYLGSGANFIGTSDSNSDAMFQIVSGYITKRYDGSTDRLLVDVHGEMKLSSITLKLSSTATINSAEYVLPINGNITITMKSGSKATVDQDIALIPGSQLIVEQNATITLSSGKSVYVYDQDAWGDKYCHSDKPFAAVYCAPSRRYTRTTADLVDASILVNGTLDASAGSFYTTSSGANIHSTTDVPGTVIITPGTATVTYQLIQSSDDPYVKIPITSAKLKNGDGTYVETDSDALTYIYTNGKWLHNNGVAEWHYEETADGTTSYYVKPYATLKNALSKYQAGDTTVGYIKMCKNTDETDCTISETVYLDLNGCDITKAVTLTGTLYGMDSATDGYGGPTETNPDPYGSIVVSGGTVAPVTEFSGKVNIANDNASKHRYLAIGTDGVWEFHRFNISVTDYYLEVFADTDATACIGFGSTLRGDSAVISAVSDLGFKINKTDDEEPTWANMTADQLKAVADKYKLYYVVETNRKDDTVANTGSAWVEFNGTSTKGSETKDIYFLTELNAYYESAGQAEKDIIDAFKDAAAPKEETT